MATRKTFGEAFSASFGKGGFAEGAKAKGDLKATIAKEKRDEEAKIRAEDRARAFKLEDAVTARDEKIAEANRKEGLSTAERLRSATEKIAVATPVIADMRLNLKSTPGVTEAQLNQFDARAASGIASVETGGTIDALFDDLSATGKNIRTPQAPKKRVFATAEEAIRIADENGVPIKSLEPVQGGFTADFGSETTAVSAREDLIKLENTAAGAGVGPLNKSEKTISVNDQRNLILQRIADTKATTNDMKNEQVTIEGQLDNISLSEELFFGGTAAGPVAGRIANAASMITGGKIFPENLTYLDTTKALAAGAYRALTGDKRLNEADARERARPLFPFRNQSEEVAKKKFEFLRRMARNRLNRLGKKNADTQSFLSARMEDGSIINSLDGGTSWFNKETGVEVK